MLVKIFDPNESERYPVVSHVFYGASEEDARSRFEDHMQYDEFLASTYEEAREGTGDLVLVEHMIPASTELDRPVRQGDLDLLSIDPLDLYLGMLDELEHTDDLNEAQEIAVTHLLEDPTYYDRQALDLEGRPEEPD